MERPRFQPRTLAGIASLIIVGLVVFAPVIPLTVQESYEDTETYTELEEYTAQVPHSVESNTTVLEVIIDHTFELGPMTFAYEPFFFYKYENITVSWNSSKEVTFFAAMLEQRWDDLYFVLSMKLGMPTINAMMNGTELPPETIGSIKSVFNETLSALPMVDYYARDSIGELSTTALADADYSLVVLSFGEEGTLNATLSYTYVKPVTEIVFVEETLYRNVTKTRPVTKTREVERRVTLLQFLTSGR
jgi:hypothetical protein